MFFVLSKLSFLFLRPSNAFLIAILLGLLLRRTVRFRRWGTAFFSVGLGLLVACAWLGLPWLLLTPLEQRFPRIDPPAVAPTGIIVLGGSIDTSASAETGVPELLDGTERMTMAAELARRYPQARLVFTGGIGILGEGGVTEAAVAARLFEGFGIARERIVYEDKARNTRENAVLTWDLVQPKPEETWLLVTSAFHMTRSMGVFRAAGWRNVTAFPVDFRISERHTFLGQNYASLNLFLTDVAVREWIGLAAYRFAGYTDALFPAP